MSKSKILWTEATWNPMPLTPGSHEWEGECGDGYIQQSIVRGGGK